MKVVNLLAEVDKDKCKGCKTCEKVCPVQNAVVAVGHVSNVVHFMQSIWLNSSSLY